MELENSRAKEILDAIKWNHPITAASDSWTPSERVLIACASQMWLVHPIKTKLPRRITPEEEKKEHDAWKIKTAFALEMGETLPMPTPGWDHNYLDSMVDILAPDTSLLTRDEVLAVARYIEALDGSIGIDESKT
ncbi:MAG: hypothetical protein KIS92_04875 [Planctomycetota bacterium]|nr:hypothetical protein [Planctomycetota bacterium]